MKNLLNLNGLYDSSPNQTGETQSRQNRTEIKPRSNRGQVVLTLLLFFLTLGVGQIWAYTDVHLKDYTRIYFDNSASNWDFSYTYFCMHNENASYVTLFGMTRLSNTKLYRYYREGSGDWNNADYFCLMGANGDWGSDGKNWDNMDGNAGNVTNTYHNYEFKKNNFYCITPNKTGTKGDRASISVSRWDASVGSLNTVLNKTQTVQARVSENGGSTYSDADFSSWPGTIKVAYTELNSGSEYETTTHAAANMTNNSQYAIYTSDITFTAYPNSVYDFAGWSESSTGNPTDGVTSKTYSIPWSAKTIYAFFKRKQFTVTFAPKGTYGTSTVTAAISASSISSGSKQNYDSRITFTASPASGYNIEGWYSDEACTISLDNGTNTTYTVASLTAATDVYVKFEPKRCNITLDYQTSAEGYQSSGSISNTVGLTATYDAAMTGLTGTMPVAKDGYAFMGFYTGMNGSGTKYYNANGSSAAAWTEDTESPTTLYAYYQKAQITALAFAASIVRPGEEGVSVTPSIDPTPNGTAYICWKVLQNNGNLYTPEINFSPEPSTGENSVTFTAPAESGTYLVCAVLRTSGSCTGASIDSVTAPFQVAGDHTITVQYKCGDEQIMPSSPAVGKPLDWTEIEAPEDPFGYTFSKWKAGDGITIKDADSNGENASRTINFKANYDGGKLTAIYTQKNIIYFKNTLGWSEVYVNLLSGQKWDNTQGTGNDDCYYSRNNRMSPVPGETDVYYYEYGATSTSEFVSFMDRSLENYHGFEGTEADPVHVCYPTIPNPNNAQSEMAYFGFYSKTPMFVPSKAYYDATSEGDLWNKSKARYCNSGYWTKYTSGTGYYLRIYDPNDASKLIKKIAFTSEDDLIPMTATADLEANKTYKFEVSREDQQYYSNGGTMNYDDRYGQGTPWELYRPSTYTKTGFTTTAAGDYVFHLTHGDDNGDGIWRLRIAAEYPIADGDYRVVYSDGVQTKALVSKIVTNNPGGKDTVSFFIRPGSAPVMKIQQATVNASTGAISWSPGTNITTTAGLTSLAGGTGVYNICLQMNESGAISVENVEAYTGNFYIRTDAANNKWDNYRAADHLMTYSEYSDTYSDYTHYFMAHVDANTNVKFVIANDYSPCISDTVIRHNHKDGDASHVTDGGNIKVEANVRFMWEKSTNEAYRAYLAPAQSDGSEFLVLRANSSDDLKDENGNNLLQASNSNQAGYNHKAPNNCMQFVDDENWIYETTVMVNPGAWLKLYAKFNNSYFYFKGKNNDTWDEDNAIHLISGSGDLVKVRVVYDFKTDRLVAAYLPSGNIDEQMDINADVMFIREHQGDIDQLTFSKPSEDAEMGAITDINTAYAVMRFNKWTLNNKSKEEGHAVLASPASIYERSLYYVSFPFEVNLNEVFGFGTYGVHWIIQRYRGDLRAAQGYWAESKGFWEFIWDRNGVTLDPKEGYILTLDLDKLGEESSVWAHNNERAELYFPSKGNNLTITNTEFSYNLPEHTCTINWTVDQSGNTTGLPGGNDPRTTYDRRIVDSHWNIMSVPTYYNANATFAKTTWADDDEIDGPRFLYTWNSTNNSLSATTATGFVYHAMHAYTVQHYGAVTWATSVSPTAAPQRNKSHRGEYQFCIQLQQNGQMVDRTYVGLSDKENTSAGFAFGEDLVKDFSGNNAKIYSIIGNDAVVAGNTLPLSTSRTTVVPVGVQIKSAGDYTFAMPEGTNGVGVTLIDNETGVRTSLSALDYTVNLEPGTYDSRFLLEISPVQNTPTDLGNVQGDNEGTKVRKVLIDGILYIVKDGKMFDARGTLVR